MSGTSRQKIDRAVLIAGPTASGKSALALGLARETGGVIVNADAMQVYDVLRVLTARPDDQALATVPHELYGHVHPSTAYSVATWLADVERLAGDGAFRGRTAIFVGGTGLYFSALTQGLSEIPQVAADIRARLRGRLVEEGSSLLYRELHDRDPVTAARLRVADGQRIVRALEVLEATGRSLTHWQGRRVSPLVDPGPARLIVLDPDREELKLRIDARFDRMIEAGAMDEVRALRRLELDPSLPAMKAIGVRELGAALNGEITPVEAIARAKIATRQYAKRQQTWLRRQFDSSWERIGSLSGPLARISRLNQP